MNVREALRFVPNESKTEGKTVNHDMLVDKWDLFAKRKTPRKKPVAVYSVVLGHTVCRNSANSILYYVTVYVRKIRKC
jgi:hypothetical protein